MLNSTALKLDQLLYIYIIRFLRLEYSCAHIFTYPDNFAMLLQLDSMLNSSFQNKDVACGVIASLRYACFAKFRFFVCFFYYTMEIDI